MKSSINSMNVLRKIVIVVEGTALCLGSVMEYEALRYFLLNGKYGRQKFSWLILSQIYEHN
jgi:hypothetical protein